MPAHSSAICTAMPELFKSPNGGIINFASDEAVQAMRDIIDEVCELFPSSPYIHLGADEANLHGLDLNPQFQDAIQPLRPGDRLTARQGSGPIYPTNSELDTSGLQRRQSM
jgi:N-acetyl-beta-hexosaminidase